jgi:hypothetical protein
VEAPCPAWYICVHMPALKRTTILAEPDLLDRLDRHARRTRSTKTAVIAAALEAYLAAHEAAPPLAFIGVERQAGTRRRADGGG